jgi:ATP-dependent phosphofructokinase / diphosphate-dependent phosphofructokinase
MTQFKEHQLKTIRIGVLTSGGDCAGLNPAIRSVVTAAMDDRVQRDEGIKFEVLGIRDGWRGLLNAETGGPKFEENIWPLSPQIVADWDRFGGTFLGTSRTNPFDPKNDRSRIAVDNVHKLGLDVLIAVGGDDTIGAAIKLSQLGINVVGIPKTIDKDLPETEYSLGYETALNVIVEEIDRLRTTANSHHRVFVVEIMGRTAGWLALEGGEAAGADMILIPEYDFSMARVNELLLEKHKAGAKYQMIAASEGAKPTGGAEFFKGEAVDSFGHKKLGGIGEWLADEITRGTKLETRSVVLSHLQRGGNPCAYDRRMGRYFGIAAIGLVLKKDFGKMVCLRNGRISSVAFDKVMGRLSLIDARTQYDTERYSGRRTMPGI